MYQPGASSLCSSYPDAISDRPDCFRSCQIVTGPLKSRSSNCTFRRSRLTLAMGIKLATRRSWPWNKNFHASPEGIGTRINTCSISMCERINLSRKSSDFEATALSMPRVLLFCDQMHTYPNLLESRDCYPGLGSGF